MLGGSVVLLLSRRYAGAFPSYFLPTDDFRLGQRCVVDERGHVSVFASRMGGNILFYSTAYIAQDVFLYLAYLLAKHVVLEFVGREGGDSSAAVTGLLPPVLSGRCLVSEVCQTRGERTFARTG